jgi:hypothetical protein
MPKKVFSKDMFASIWPILCTAPDTQISEELQEELRDFDFDKATDLEVYVFCSELSPRAFSTHDISSFIRVLLDVAKFYERPEDNEAIH